MSSSVAGYVRRVAPWACAAVLYLTVAVVLLWPAVSACSTTVMGSEQPSDTTAGGVWLGWTFLHSGGPFASTNAYVDAPHGAALWQPQFMSALLWLIPDWGLSHVVGPVCAFNVGMLTGLVLDGLAMFALARWLTRRTPVALIAGYAYAFTPFHLEKTFGHIAYVHSWAFPLLILAMLAMYREPSARRAALCGLALAAAVYMDGYYLVFAPLTLALGALAIAWVNRRSRAVRAAHLRTSVRAATIAGVLCAPVLVAGVLGSHQLTATLARSQSDVVTYSAHASEYVLPAHSDPLLGRFVSTAEAADLNGSNFMETSLYLGLSVLFAALWFVHRGRRDDERSADLPLPGRTLIAVLATIAAGAFIVSLGGRPLGLPMPSELIWRVAPLFRSFGRLFVVVDAAVVALAALALARLPRTAKGHVMLGVAGVVIAVDLLAAPPWQSWSYSSVPAAYTWLAAQPGGGSVAEYPMTPSVLGDAYQSYLMYQPVHAKPLFNGAPTGSDDYGVERGVADLLDAQTVPALRQLGVRWVMVHTDRYVGGAAALQSIPGLTSVFTDGAIHVFTVGAGPRAGVALAVGDGFALETATASSVQRWTNAPTSELRVARLDPAQPATGYDVTLRLSSYATPRRVTIRQGATVLWSGTAPPRSIEVSLRLPGDGALSFEATPGPQTVPYEVTVDGTAGVDVAGLSITPAR